MAPAAKSRIVSVGLFVSYFLLAVISGLGVAVGYLYLEEPTVNASLVYQAAESRKALKTTPAPYGFEHRYYQGNEHDNTPEEEKLYSALNGLASYSNWPHTYLMIPCATTAVVATILMMVGLCSRSFFHSTMPLYQSLMLVVIHLLMLAAFMSKYVDDELFPCWLSSWKWVCGFNSSLLVYLIIQVIVAMWELRRQEVGWPVLNIRNLFTLDAWAIGVITGMITVAASLFSGSGFMHGYKPYNCTDWYVDSVDCVYQREPEYYVFPIGVVFLFGTVTMSSSLASSLFGILRRNLMTACEVTMMICLIGVSIVTSPFFGRVVLYARIYNETWAFSTISVIIIFIHVALSLFAPRVLLHQPAAVNLAISSIKNAMKAQLHKEKCQDELCQLETFSQKVMLLLNPDSYRKSCVYSAVFSLTSIVLGSINVSGPWESWGHYVFLAGNTSILVHSLISIIINAAAKQESVPVIRKVLEFFFEGLIIVVGSVGIFISYPSGLSVAACIISILLIIIQAKVLSTAPAFRTAVKQLIVDGSDQPILDTENSETTDLENIPETQQDGIFSNDSHNP